MKNEDRAHYERTMAEARAGWMPGPWDGEPDRAEWRAHGLACLITRSQMGHLCGYVGVPSGHPAYDVESGRVNVDVHGGLTYGGRCNGAICHVPQPGEDDAVYWLGFDCAHAGDYGPIRADMHARYPELFDEATERGHGCTYKDMAYVRGEVEHLARQLANYTATSDEGTEA